MKRTRGISISYKKKIKMGAGVYYTSVSNIWRRRNLLDMQGMYLLNNTIYNKNINNNYTLKTKNFFLQKNIKLLFKLNFFNKNTS